MEETVRRAALIILLAALVALPGAWSYASAPDVDPSVLREAVAPSVPFWPEGLSPSPSPSPTGSRQSDEDRQVADVAAVRRSP